MSRDFSRFNSKSSLDSKDTINIIKDQSDENSVREIRVIVTEEDFSEQEVANEKYSI